MMLTLVSPTIAAQPAGKPLVYPGPVSVACVSGTATVSVPSDTTEDGIFYVITQPDASGNFQVTAQVGDAYYMAGTPGNGWTATNNWNAVYTGVAPDCSAPTGPTTTQPTTTNPGTGPSVFALPLDCGTAPYPAPSGSNVGSVIGFSNYVLTQNGVAHTSGNITLTQPNEVLTLSFDWDASTYVQPGQYFVFEGPLDSSGNKVFASPKQWFPVWNHTGEFQAGCASVVDGDITVQFTSYVTNRWALGGSVELELELARDQSVESTTVDFTFDDGSTFSITIPGKPIDLFGKRGWFNRDDQGIEQPITSIRWQIHVPANADGYNNLVLADIAPAGNGWSFSCAGPAATSTMYNATAADGSPVHLDFSEQCSATAMTLTVARVPANTTVNFFFDADISSTAEGPFYNEATASADNLNTVPLDYEVRRTKGRGVADGIYSVTPQFPSITHAACVDEVNDTWIPAKVVLPTGPDGVSYVMTPNPFPETGGYVKIVASLDEGYYWANDISGWTFNESDNTMIYEAQVTNDPCVIETVTPTPDYPCVPPTPEVCIPTPTPEGENPPGEGTPTPPPCVPGPTPTVPAWCLVTPTPPTVNELPKTGGDQGSGNSTLIAAGMLAATVIAAAGAVTYRERTR